MIDGFILTLIGFVIGVLFAGSIHRKAQRI